MNAYDFDKTIFKGDSTRRFYIYCLIRNPKIALRLPKMLLDAIFVLPKDKTRFKQNMFGFLKDLKDPNAFVNGFWQKNMRRIKSFYLNNAKPEDVIISASPEFLLLPVQKLLGFKTLIASRVDINTGAYTGVNCSGEEKVRRFLSEFPHITPAAFYSDSHSDDPMAKISSAAYMVRGEKLSRWRF